MKSISIKLTLQDDAVITRSSGTTGAHESLDYIPGGKLLGAAAAQFYSKFLGSKHAWDVFHSGKVRFGDARPLSSAGLPSQPVPFCWHHAKGTAVTDKADQLQAEEIYNLAVMDGFEHRPTTLAQHKQLRNGYLTASGNYIPSDARSRYAIKTAISPDSRDFGRSLPEALFGYHAISAGKCFLATITLDEDVSDEIFKELTTWISKQPIISIGRSRSAEFGRAQLSAYTPVEVSWPQAESAVHTDHLILFATSDLALRDAYGQPDFGPSLGKLIPERSFLRTRRYTPWNSYRKAPDLERTVIMAGSVLVYQSAGHPLAGMSGLQWIGAYQHDGLGCVEVNPPWLLSQHPSFAAVPVAVNVPTTKSVQPLANATTHLASQRATMLRDQGTIDELARQWSKDWGKYEPQPSKSQWGKLRHLASTAKDKAAFITGLGNPTAAGTGILNHGVAAQAWKKSEFKNKSLAAHLYAQFEKNETKLSDATLLATCRETCVLRARASKSD